MQAVHRVPAGAAAHTRLVPGRRRCTCAPEGDADHWLPGAEAAPIHPTMHHSKIDVSHCVGVLEAAFSIGMLLLGAKTLRSG